MDGLLAMKKKDTVIREFVRSLNDDSIKFIYSRLNARLGGDLGEAVEVLQENAEVDKIMLACRDSTSFFDALDECQEYLDKEIRRRSYGGSVIGVE